MSVCIEHNNQVSQHFPTRGCTQSIRKFSALERVHKTILLWMRRSRQRKQLAGLNQRLLDDIGYTREQARLEYNKPFWK